MRHLVLGVGLMAICSGLAGSGQGIPFLPPPTLVSDLIISEVRFTRGTEGGSFKSHTFWVGVKNIGLGQSGNTKVAVLISVDVTGANPV